MPDEARGTMRYFDSVPRQWDAFYSHENKLMYMINKILRKGLYERYKFTFDQCGDLSAATVLDVGCGTGRYSIECVKRGAERVVGIDFAPAMVEFSEQIADQMGLSDKCSFVEGDVLTYNFEETFDIVLALGFFDYIKDSQTLFKKIAALKPAKFIASFPKFTPIWGTQRHIRYHWIKKCPIYNYTKGQLEELYENAGFTGYTIVDAPMGFFGFGQCEED